MEYAELKLTQFTDDNELHQPKIRKEAADTWYFIDKELWEYYNNNKSLKSQLYLSRGQLFFDKYKLHQSHASMQSWIHVLPVIDEYKDMRKGVKRYLVNESIHKFIQYQPDEWYLKDHYKLAVKNRKYIFITQPYWPSLDAYKALERKFTSIGLYVDISYKDAWHNPGACPLIVISQFPIELEK